MIKKIISTLVVLLSFFVSTQAQYKLSVQGGIGYYLSNSENSTKIMGGKKYLTHFPVGLSVQTNKLFDLNLSLEYSYNEIIKKDVLTFRFMGPNGPEQIDSLGVDATLVNHNFDLNYIRNIYSFLTYGIGPSFVITNRIIESGSSNLSSEYWR